MLVADVVVGGTVDAFDAAARDTFAARFAGLLGTPVDHVSLNITSASVRITAIVEMLSAAAALDAVSLLKRATPASLSAALGQNVESISSRVEVVALLPNNRSSVPMGDVAPSSSSAPLADQSNATTEPTSALLFGVIGGAVAFVLCAVFAFMHYRRRRGWERTPPTPGVTPGHPPHERRFSVEGGKVARRPTPPQVKVSATPVQIHAGLRNEDSSSDVVCISLTDEKPQMEMSEVGVPVQPYERHPPSVSRL